MQILVIGGTRFFGIHMVNELLKLGHDVTIATRGKSSDGYGDNVQRIYEQIKRQAEYALWQKYFDRNWIAVRYPFVSNRKG